MQKDKFPLKPDRLAAIVLLLGDQPQELYLIPATAWKVPNALLVDRDYEGKKSKPEWGLYLSKENRSLLDKFRFDGAVESLMQPD